MSVSTVRLEEGELLSPQLSPCPGDGSGVHQTNIRNEIRDDAANIHNVYSVGRNIGGRQINVKEEDGGLLSNNNIDVVVDNNQAHNNEDDDDDEMIDTNNKNGQGPPTLDQTPPNIPNIKNNGSDNSIDRRLNEPMNIARCYIDKLHGLSAEGHDHEWVDYADKVQAILASIQDEWKSLDQARKLAIKSKPASDIRSSRGPGRWPGRPKTIKRDSPINKTDSDNSSSERTSSRR